MLYYYYYFCYYYYYYLYGVSQNVLHVSTQFFFFFIKVLMIGYTWHDS